jgi:hypothetical protein
LRSASARLRQIFKTAQPDKGVGVVQVAKLGQHGHAGGILRFEEFTVKQVDQRLAGTAVAGGSGAVRLQGWQRYRACGLS